MKCHLKIGKGLMNENVHICSVIITPRRMRGKLNRRVCKGSYPDSWMSFLNELTAKFYQEVDTKHKATKKKCMFHSPQNQIIFNALSSWMKTNQGWTLDTKFNFNYLIRPFFPISLGKISEGFGLMFLIMLLNKKIIKELHYIPVAMILIIFAVGQTLPRYYFEAYLILAYYFNKPNKFTEIVIFSQISIIFLLALTCLYLQ